MNAKKKDAEESFSRRMQRLENIVERLESDEIELEDALAAFEEGVKLTKELGASLDAAQRRIEILLRDASGAMTLQPFDPGLDGDEGNDTCDEDESGES